MPSLSFYEEYRDQEWHKKQDSERSGGRILEHSEMACRPRFGGAVVRAVREDRLLYREAYSLTGLRGDTFERIPEKMEVLL